MLKGNDNNLNEAAIETALRALPRVEAPMSFEANVRSRIAEGSGQADWQPSWMLGLKFALPTFALLLLGVFLLFPSGSEPNQTAVLPVRVETQTPANDQVFPDAPGPVADGLRKKSELAARTTNGQQNSNLNLPGSKPSTAEQPGGGSRDEAGGQPSAAIYPEGIDPNRKPVKGLQPPTGSGIAVEAILGMLGIRSECKENGCIAAAVAKQSIAEKAGVKAADLIEAIDDKPVKAGTVFEGTINVKTLRVSRGGKRLTINLK